MPSCPSEYVNRLEKPRSADSVGCSCFTLEVVIAAGTRSAVGPCPDCGQHSAADGWAVAKISARPPPLRRSALLRFTLTLHSPSASASTSASASASAPPSSPLFGFLALTPRVGSFILRAKFRRAPSPSQPSFISAPPLPPDCNAPVNT